MVFEVGGLFGIIAVMCFWEAANLPRSRETSAIVEGMVPIKQEWFDNNLLLFEYDAWEVIKLLNGWSLCGLKLRFLLSQYLSFLSCFLGGEQISSCYCNFGILLKLLFDLERCFYKYYSPNHFG